MATPRTSSERLLRGFSEPTGPAGPHRPRPEVRKGTLRLQGRETSRLLLPLRRRQITVLAVQGPRRALLQPRIADESSFSLPAFPTVPLLRDYKGRFCEEKPEPRGKCFHSTNKGFRAGPCLPGNASRHMAGSGRSSGTLPGVRREMTHLSNGVFQPLDRTAWRQGG